MAFDAIKTLTSRTVVLTEDNIDTDQIIPARFLTTTSREGLGDAAFYDWRHTAEGAPRNDISLNLAKEGSHSILVAGANFACGSSREHAPWALLDLGLRAVISSDIADIFTSNALKNGLLPIEVGPELHRELLDNPGLKVTIDLESQRVEVVGGRSEDFKVEAFARYCLLEGVDPLGYLIGKQAEIAEFERV